MNLAMQAISVDKQRVTHPIGFRGHHLELTVFAVFAPLTQ
jgi:cell division protein FtsA